mmetsp:Transcript_12616/g.36101  ORF Transcript_12616/g.36101 Transcript_12616/m.36101 type:complete len:248 (+) Transcript_12616:27-770(+)
MPHHERSTTTGPSSSSSSSKSSIPLAEQDSQRSSLLSSSPSRRTTSRIRVSRPSSHAWLLMNPAASDFKKWSSNRCSPATSPFNSIPPSFRKLNAICRYTTSKAARNRFGRVRTASSHPSRSATIFFHCRKPSSEWPSRNARNANCNSPRNIAESPPYCSFSRRSSARDLSMFHAVRSSALSVASLISGLGTAVNLHRPACERSRCITVSDPDCPPTVPPVPIDVPRASCASRSSSALLLFPCNSTP